MSEAPSDPAAAIRGLLHRADDAAKAAPNQRVPEGARERITRLLDAARSQLPALADDELRLDLAAQVARRFAALDRDGLEAVLGPSPDVRRAPTGADVDPARVPPGQHLTAGWPVLHVGGAPADVDPATWRVVVTGRVRTRTVLTVAELRDRLPVVTTRSDLHCVTGWSRLDNDWEGVRLVDLIGLAGPRPEATHLLASGHPAYSANLALEAAGAADVVVAWSHDGVLLDRAHGGPIRLVVPARYGWKSVKWLTELRLLDREVRGYWEERGYHDVADPWTEQRFRG
ncbi:molybdopterin-dependent oxidoreductase [Nitriliruptor alkaliphilus]|uniref:molybdopterin-dependent oxidoreductase n=1 Tax=Nitriliruptor alkaliphilus TaxID=427918 RepID=UPI000697FDA1|nr:molybdopterin-dependent oxidoreductase [Nitriliruptor alkaliphilus]